VTPYEVKAKLDELLALPAETEWVEFKQASNNFHFPDLGKYFSALSNEACLKGQPWAWLVFGVQDKPKQVVGTQYRPNRADLDNLKKEIADKTSNRITFEEIYVLIRAEGRVIMFQIPPAAAGVPTAWEGHYYGRDGESLGPLNILEIEQIRQRGAQADWSRQVCEDATLDALDPLAIAKARDQYSRKHPEKAAEVASWDDMTFLNKAKVLINCRVTNAAIVLLGKEESEALLSPAVARITWVLRDPDGTDRDYAHFGPPFLLNTDAVFARIRNLTYRHLRDNSLFPTEISKYDPWVIREALHNCVAHQDYRLRGRVNLVEEQDSLLFTNLGEFIPRTVRHVIEQDAPPEHYRNPFLAAAMVNLNMIDTIGSGIKRMFTTQWRRFFPLPDYDLSEPQKVKVRVLGKVLDENYVRVLMSQTNLDLVEVMALDKVQKRQEVSDEEFRLLKTKGLIEGRRPNLYVAAQIAAVTGDKSSYIKNRAFDKAHYKGMVLAFLKKYGSASRREIDDLLMSKLSDALDEAQKRTRIKNLLYEMNATDGTIRAEGPRKSTRWVLANPANEGTS
jgi:ATP-dependent DNA helicase RecG